MTAKFGGGICPPNALTGAITQTYSYDLFGNLRPDGSLEVVYGTWTDTMDGPIPVSSLRFHPDFVSIMPKTKKLGSRNSKIDPEIVREILGQ